MTENNTQIATRVPTAVAQLGERLNVDPTELKDMLKNTVFKGASDSEFVALTLTANEYQLNPLLKEIYAFPQKGGGIVPVVGIDGWTKIINRQPDFDGMDVDFSEDGKSATCTIYHKDRNHPTRITEFLDECRRPTEPWKMMPKRMLRHKAIIQAGRVAFGLGGIHDEDEAKDFDGMKRAAPEYVRDSAVNPFEQAKQIEGGDGKSTGAPPDGGSTPPASTNSATADEAKKPKAELQRAMLSDVKEKTGNKKDGTPWTAWVADLFVGGKQVTAGTFSKTLGERSLKLKGGEVLVGIEATDKGYKLTHIEAAPAEDEKGGLL